jgi:uncharacterized protein
MTNALYRPTTGISLYGSQRPEKRKTLGIFFYLVLKDLVEMTALFLYRIQPVRPEMLSEGSTETESRIAGEHFSYLKDLTEKGVVAMAGRTTNTESNSFGIVVLRAESVDIAKQIMHEDPAVKNRVFRAELFPFRISLLKSENVD